MDIGAGGGQICQHQSQHTSQSLLVTKITYNATTCPCLEVLVSNYCLSAVVVWPALFVAQFTSRARSNNVYLCECKGMQICVLVCMVVGADRYVFC